MKELRDCQVSARIKPRAKRIMDNSKYSYADAIEYFAFDVLNKKTDKRQRLKDLKIENNRMNYEMCRNQMEIDDLSKELGINPDDDFLFADEIKRSVKAVIGLFKREEKIYQGNIDYFFDLKGNKLMHYADECDMSLKDFRERVISEYYSQRRKDKKEDDAKH